MKGSSLFTKYPPCWINQQGGYFYEAKTVKFEIPLFHRAPHVPKAAKCHLLALRKAGCRRQPSRPMQSAHSYF
jgi:hypothetical protein